MFNSITIPRDLLPYFCCKGGDGIKSAINLGLTSKKNYRGVSKPTFWQALISQIGGAAIVLRHLYEIPQSGMVLNLPLVNGWVQNAPTLTKRVVNEIRYGDTFEGAGIDRIVECERGRYKILLERDSIPKQFDVPASEIESNFYRYRDSITFVSSEDLVVVNHRSSDEIYLFSAKTCEYLRKIKLERTAVQIHMTKKNLFVRESAFISEWVAVYDIESAKKINQIQLEGRSVQKPSICFGETNFIHLREKTGHYSLQIYSMKNLVENTGCAKIGEYRQENTLDYSDHPHVFSEENHFIVLTPKAEGVKIERIKYADDNVYSEVIEEKISLGNADQEFYVKNCYYHAGRIFAASSRFWFLDKNFPSDHIISYDLKTKNKQEFSIDGREELENIYIPKFSLSYKENAIRVHFACVECTSDQLRDKKKFFSTLEYENSQ